MIDKVTIFHEKCYSLYVKELLKLLLSGLDMVIISLDDLVSYITELLTRRTRRFPLEEQDIFTLPEHQRSSTILFYRVRVAQSLLFCVEFGGSRFVSFFLS